MPSKIPVFVINLAKDVDRLANVKRQFQSLGRFDVRIIEGCNGSTLANAVTFALTQDYNWKLRKGTIGCFLSHVSAWEAVASSSQPFGIVLEDDVNAIELARFDELIVPGDADIIFLNNRLSPKLGGEPIRALPILTALQELDRSRSGPGGDGYILTAQGAMKMLSDCQRSLFHGHVDGRLLRYATTIEDLTALPDGSWIRTVVEQHHHPSLKPALGILKAYVVSTPLVTHGGGVSSREREDAATEDKGR